MVIPYSDTIGFQLSKGILQGDTLAPFFLIILLDYAMRITHVVRISTWVPEYGHPLYLLYTNINKHFKIAIISILIKY